MSVCEGFFRSASMLQRVLSLRDENGGLVSESKASKTIAAELQCRVVSAERKLLEKENVGALLKRKEKAGWMAERERLVEDIKHYKAAASVLGLDADTLYVELEIVQEDNQKLAAERH
ncbi:hypothetical protein HanRHA438_Chr14g0632601 [Helianthus annuus]|uniref:Uncharacterized protein n=1 Tax=Helianthus annuus TaxID=4232 RepID=A0A9K3H5Y8_HELAN|nr:hypothetical protein HanXRQr2_Chr14g0622601 [Helianthus annuus]KAJ0484225.1 hypothetical protein HanHA89_Chr14g0541721 [Helianthus annuus]KAJ0654779.1 hypothetical protein HanLR1_Chr14g0510951 [Helianthus annuus]KAJ0658525.1 hypothetical protein HanOQP8_Chr14g0509191 [Helianthus annuus]KAJ0838666.1 hypothetical protein HanPSC8_Chr14g0597451 [Helianthus annuus]